MPLSIGSTLTPHPPTLASPMTFMLIAEILHIRMYETMKPCRNIDKTNENNGFSYLNHGFTVAFLFPPPKKIPHHAGTNRKFNEVPVVVSLSPTMAMISPAWASLISSRLLECINTMPHALVTGRVCLLKKRMRTGKENGWLEFWMI